jgi:hypothetical protein
MIHALIRFERQLNDERSANEKRCERLVADAGSEMSRNRSLWETQQENAIKASQQELMQMKISYEEKITQLKAEHKVLT